MMAEDDSGNPQFCHVIVARAKDDELCVFDSF